MVITQTPFRMSFFGGGTDFPDFYREHGGAVISTTFDKYCYVSVRHLPRFFDYTNELIYSKIERVGHRADIQHPAIRNAMEMMDMHELRLTYDADLPARSGLGTSSSFAVGMLNAFYALKGKYADKRRLADEAIRLERELCGESGGVQDQIAASFGGIWQCTVNGFAGVRVVGGKLRIQPNLPDAWSSLKAKIFWKGQELQLTVTKNSLTVTRLTGNQPTTFLMNGTEHTFTDEITLPCGK